MFTIKHFCRLAVVVLGSMCFAVSAGAATPSKDVSPQTPSANVTEAALPAEAVNPPREPSRREGNDPTHIGCPEPFQLLWYSPRRLLWSGSLS